MTCMNFIEVSLPGMSVQTILRCCLRASMDRRPADMSRAPYRSGTVSLGICAVPASTWPDLRFGVSVSDRERPLATGVKGTLMAQRTAVSPALMAAPRSSPVLLDSCCPSGRGRRVKAREATACGLA